MDTLKKYFFSAVLISGILLSSPVNAKSKSDYIVLASTTSTENSGLFAHILPMFESQSGIKVRVVAVGTGQAQNTHGCHSYSVLDGYFAYTYWLK